MRHHRTTTVLTGLASGTLALIFLASGARAANPNRYFSDAGGPKTWDNGTTFDWASHSLGPYIAPWYNGANAYFEGIAGIVNVGETINSVNSITFNVDGYTLGGSMITLTGAGGNITTGAGTDSIESPLGGSVGLTKLGSGILQLSQPPGMNNYSGATTINAGTLQLGTPSFPGLLPYGTAVSLANVSGAVLDLNGQGQIIASLSGGGINGGNVALGAGGLLIVGDSTSITYAGAINGTGSLAKQGSGTLTLTGANIYTGTTTINTGTLQLSGGSNRLPTGTAVALANASSAVLDLNDQDQTIASLSGGGASGGRVTLGIGTLSVGDASSTTFSGSITSGINGWGGLVKQGPGTLTLTGVNNGSGPITINAGTLRLDGGPNRLFPNCSVTLANVAGATLDLNNCTQNFTTIDGGGAVGGNIALGSATLVINLGTGSYAGIISGPGSLIFHGSVYPFDTQTLSGANTYSGTTTVDSGTLEIAGGIGVSGTSLIDVQSGRAVFKTVSVNKPNLNINTAALATFEVVNSAHVVGAISGNGITKVDTGGSLTAASISQDTLTVGSGATIIIQAIPGGPHGGTITPVPEPSSFVLLAGAFIMALYC